LTDRDIAGEGTQAGGWEGERRTPRRAGGPDVGLGPGTLGS